MQYTARLGRLLLGMALFVGLIGPALPRAAAQPADLAALLEVLASGVEVQRVDTANYVPVQVESVVGAGDYIRTDATGRARITFFRDGTSVELEPGTAYFIKEFSGTEDQFRLSVAVLIGITRQQFERLLDADSSYEVETPGATMVVRGTAFDIRVEDGGRSSVLTAEGLVEARSARAAAEIPPAFGLRAEDGSLSDVVPATTFEELDIALDGCGGSFSTGGDVRLNVRVGPDRAAARVGSIIPENIQTVIGIDESGQWYRIPFRGGYGWVLSETLTVEVDPDCPVTIYPPTRTEDVGRYTLVGDLEVNASVQAEAANLRERPALDQPILTVLDFGTELIITGRNADSSWLRVRTLDGRAGWMAAFLVEIDTDLAQIGVVPTGDNEAPEPGSEPDDTGDTDTPDETPADGEPADGEPAGGGTTGDADDGVDDDGGA